MPFVADCLSRVIAFAPSGRLGGFFSEPGFEVLGGHINELIELSTAESVEAMFSWDVQLLAHSMTVSLSLTMLGRFEI